jgi:halocyanin-like protein
MDTSQRDSYTRRGLLRAGAGAATAGTVVTATTGTASAQGEVYGGHFSNTDNFEGMTADATGQDGVTLRVGAGGNGASQAFDPPAIVVDPGTTVTWEWTGNGGPHNVVHWTDADPERDTELFNSQGVAHEGVAVPEAGTTFEWTFEEAGSFYPYVCTPHRALGMKGVVVVGADNAQTDLVEYTLGSGPMNTVPIWGGAFTFGLVSFVGVAAYRALVGDEE